MNTRNDFQLLPAIDLMDGCVVRLKKGEAEKKTIYSTDPATFARKWEDAGGDWIHLVDLDAAFSGSFSNLAKVREITRAVGIPCELGGGIRDREAVERAFDAGVSRVILGTKAAESVEFVREICREFGSSRVAVGIDAKDGKVATRGWVHVTDLDCVDFARSMEEAGAGCLICTDIATDGMLQGPNLPALVRIAERVQIPVIASGGVSSKQDLRALHDTGVLAGAIIGVALYEGKITPPLKDFADCGQE